MNDAGGHAAPACLEVRKNITVAGRIISELSDKIPTYLIALNELIKNAYDAGAKEVRVFLNTREQKLTISDNGFGMGEKEVDELLHISTSDKHFGKINPITQRYIQGSKGLGFLSVFKFGQRVKWETIKNAQKRCFEIDYNEIIIEEDINNFAVDIHIEPCTQELTGTKIDIFLNEDSLAGLRAYWDNPINRDKILNSFLDDDFTIIIDVDGKCSETKRIELAKLYPGKQTFKVTYNSLENIVSFYCLETGQTKRRSFGHKKTRFELTVTFMIFDFTGGRPKNSDEPLFIDFKNRIIPLIYINKNLFNNFDLFDPDMIRSTKGGTALPQIAGYVEIISDDNDMQFNSDRTNFQQNALTSEIIQDLENLNRYIQTEGSKIKSNLKTPPPASTGTPPTPPSTGVPPESPPTSTPPAPPSTSAPPSPPTETPPSSSTGMPPPLGGTTPKRPLIPNYFGKGYQLNFDCPIAMLLHQINQLDSKRSDYSAVISCALRALFELALYELRKNGKVKFITKETEFATRVQNLINIVANDKAMVTTICNGISFGFPDLNNLLKVTDFKIVISKAHLAAHKSTEFIGANDIQDIGKAAGLFLTICNEILNNTNLNWGLKEI